MKKVKIISLVAFLCALVSVPVLFSVSSLVGQADVFGIGAIIYYSWIIYFALVFAAASLAVGILMKKKGLPHFKKNLVVAVIVFPLALIFGSYRFIFSSSFDYSDAIVRSVEEKTSIALPEAVRTVTEKEDEYSLGNAVIEDAGQKEAFEKTVQGPTWATTLNAPTRGILPPDVVAETSSFDDFMFFDCVSHQYNVVATKKGNYDCVFVAYSKAASRLLILDDYVYTI